jgi:hypothetical protein
MLNLPLNFFDLLLLAVLLGGLASGRRHSTAAQLLGLVKWLSILLGCAVVYAPAAKVIAQSGVFDIGSSCVMAYLGAALVIFLVFSFLQRRAEGKLLDADHSGETGSYLGMLSGLVRWGCMLLAAVALLHARTFTPAQIKASEKFQTDMFGSNLFPTFHAVQKWVFETSFTGPWIKQDLGFLLIDSTKLDQEPSPQTQASAR